MMKRVWRTLPGFIIFLVGVLVIIGWHAKIPLFLRPDSFSSPTTFNAGICFIIIGICLYSCAFSSVLAGRIRVTSTLLLLLILGLELGQSIFQVDLGIDQPPMSYWMEYPSPHPGRLPLNTSLGMLLTSFVFLTFTFTNKKLIAFFVEIAVFFLLIIGLVSIIGYFLNIEFLYNWHLYGNMSFYSACCFIVLALGLWMQWRQSPHFLELYRDREEQNIILRSSVILLGTGLVIGLTIFVDMANQQLGSIMDMFGQFLKTGSDQFRLEIYRATEEYNAIRKQLLSEAAIISKNNSLIDQQLNFFMVEGFSAANIKNRQGKILAEKGHFIKQPELLIPLRMQDNAALFWQKGWYLILSSPIKLSSGETGTLTAEWPLKDIDELFSRIEAVGKTAYVSICSATVDNDIACFPTRFNVHAARFSHHFHTKNEFIYSALQGFAGTMTTYDNSGHRIIVAYGPIARLGLVMLVRANAEELYFPIIKNLWLVLPLILFSVFVGLLLLRLEVSPLIRRVIKTEKKLMNSNNLLKKSEERYSLAVRGSNAGLWDWEVGTHHIFYSPYLKNMLGYTNTELSNHVEFFQKNLHPEDVEKAQQALKNHLTHRIPYDVEYRLKRKSGEYHWFHAVGQARWDENGRATRMAGSILDITERKLTEQRFSIQYTVTQVLAVANNLEEAVPKIIEAICEGLHWSYGGFWVVDEEQNLVLHSIGSWHKQNDLAQKFLATGEKKFFSEKSVLGWVVSHGKSYWSEDVTTDSNFRGGRKAKEAGFHSAFFFPVLLQNKVFGVLEFFSSHLEHTNEALLQMMASICPQIAQFIQRKNVEKELRESETHKAAILHSASDSIITVNSEGAIISFNLQTEKMFGYGKDEIKLKNINEFLPGLSQKMSSMIGKPPVEFLGEHKNKLQFPVELAISGTTINTQNLFVIIIRNITERKKIETLKNEFISVVSHELRTPLTSIRGSLGLMLGGATGTFSDKAKKLLDIASKNCERLLHLISDILDIEKIESGKMSFQMAIVDLEKIVKESIIANHMYGEKFNVKILLTESLPAQVNVDPERLLQVMANLISNAVKFSPSGGEVHVSIKKLSHKIRVSISDKGSGIPLEFQARIFQKFSQADSTTARGKGGTGLGLNITKALVEKMGGTIGFVTKPDQGTTFYFDLPRTNAEDDDEKKELTLLPSPKSLLLCEDDEDQAKYLATLLEGMHFKVDIALTINEARKLLALYSYQGLLLDLILPDQDGIAFIRELRAQEKTKSLPIIVLSVIAQTGRSMLNGDTLSVLDWLEKPIDFHKLLKNVMAIKQQNDARSINILHVEDDHPTQTVVKELLKNTAEVHSATTLEEAKIKLEEGHFNLVILDLVLPDGKGAELLPLLAKLQLPVLVFSANELDNQYAKLVKKALIKSETSWEKLLEHIQTFVIRNSRE